MPYAELIDKITREDELNKELQKLGETEEIKELRDQNNRRESSNHNQSQIPPGMGPHVAAMQNYRF